MKRFERFVLALLIGGVGLACAQAGTAQPILLVENAVVPAAAAADQGSHAIELPAVGSLDNQELAARLLTGVYGDYDKQQGCWVTVKQVTVAGDDWDYQYCMKIDRVDPIASDTGKRVYVLAAGDNIVPGSSGFGGGLVGAFVLEDHDGRTEVIASAGQIAAGISMGVAPKKWSFVKLGPSDYWGWENTEDYSQMGLTESDYAILAPFGKGIRDLAKQKLRAGRDDSGASCPNGGKTCAETVWNSKLDFDSGGTDAVFPLLIKVSGKYRGKDLRTQTFRISFDRKTWSYPPPTDPLFKAN
jgi:hypothetical protein